MDRDFKGVWIPREIYLDMSLKPIEKLLLVEIDSLSKTKEGCFVSNSKLGKFLGRSKGWAANTISDLTKRGYLEVSLIYKENSSEVERRYVKLKTGMPIHENRNTPIHENRKDNDTNSFNENICAFEQEEILKNEFEKLWEIYPNKKGKSEASKKFIKHREKTSYEIIEQGLIAYNKYIKANQTTQQFIKHGSTWFNQKSWLDDYTISTNETQNQNTNSAAATEWERVCESVRKFGDEYWQDAMEFLGAKTWNVIIAIGGWATITTMTDYNRNELKRKFENKYRE